MRPILVGTVAPSFDFLLRIVKQQDPDQSQTLAAEVAVE